MKMPEKPPKWQDLLGRYAAELPALLASTKIRELARRYFHWDELKYRPLTDGFSREEVWFALKILRQADRHVLPLTDGTGFPFSYSLPDELLRRLDELANWMKYAPAGLNATSFEGERLAKTESLLEESISSTLLEGAPTTRADARRMFLKKNPPRNVGERMVLNAFHALTEVYREPGTPMTIGRLLEIHRLFTEKTIAVPDAAGRFRRENENVRVADGEGNVFHVPPAAAADLPARVQKILDFANCTASSENAFVPPVLRAVIVHFALGYEHPFVDGNGRVARALMYWTLLHAGCHRARCVSVSEVLFRSPMRYAQAFVFPETDDNDLTYFLLHQTEMLLSAVQAREAAEAGRRVDASATGDGLSLRQRRLMNELASAPDRSVTIAGYCAFAQVSYATGRADLQDLARMKLLSARKEGRATVYTLFR